MQFAIINLTSMARKSTFITTGELSRRIKVLIREEIVWAKGRKESEVHKYTTWHSPSPECRLGGFTISTYTHNDFVGVTAHSSDGECHSKFFQIPVDRVEDFCHALMKVKEQVEVK